MNNPGTTPIRLVNLTLLGATLVLVECALYPVIRLLNNRMGEAIICFTAYFAAISLSAVNRYRLSQGIQRNLWTEDQLEAARRLIASRWLGWLAMPLYAVANGNFIYEFSSHFLAEVIFAFLILPSVAIADTKTLLRGPVAPRNWNRKPVDWSSFKPLQSSHWGEP